MRNCSSARGVIRDVVCAQRVKRDNDGYCNSVSLEGFSALTHCECSSLFVNRVVCLKKARTVAWSFAAMILTKWDILSPEKKVVVKEEYVTVGILMCRVNIIFVTVLSVFILYLWLWSFFAENIIKQVSLWLFLIVEEVKWKYMWNFTLGYATEKVHNKIRWYFPSSRFHCKQKT